MQYGFTLVDTHRILIMGTSRSCYVGKVRQPRAVFLTEDAVLRHNDLRLIAGLDMGAGQNQFGGSVPDTFTESRHTRCTEQATVQILFHLALYLLPAFLSFLFFGICSGGAGASRAIACLPEPRVREHQRHVEGTPVTIVEIFTGQIHMVHYSRF
jgi:hypothetical protein